MTRRGQYAEIMEELSRVSVSTPISAGQLILPNILNTGADLVATRSLL